MKKLLCLLLCAMVLTFTACQSEEEWYDYEVAESTAAETAPDTTSYEQAIRLMMKTFDNSFTKEELKAMYPNSCWTWFEEQKGLSLDDIYTGFSEKMAENWERTKETVGENAAVKFEYLDRTDYQGDDYEALKAEVTERYGIDPESFGICYEVKVKKATVGRLKEDIYTQLYHVAQIDGDWYVIEVLINMPVI